MRKCFFKFVALPRELLLLLVLFCTYCIFNTELETLMAAWLFLVETSTTKMKPKVPKMLEDCSNEVLTEIFSHLCKKDIFSSVALVCIRFCELTKSPKLMPKCVEIVRSKSDRQINSILDMLRINTHLEKVKIKYNCFLIKKKSNLKLKIKKNN
jgi:hypothetical protein